MTVQLNNTTVQLPVNQVLDPLLRSIDKDHIDRWNGSTTTQLDYFGNYNQIQNGTFDNMIASPFNGAFQILDRKNPPRGAFPVVITGNTIGATGDLTKTVKITVSVREPLFVSPMIFADGEGQPGLTGLSQININANMDSLATRAIRWTYPAPPAAFDKSVVSVEYNNSFIEVKLLQPKASDLIPQTTITPLASYVNYILPAPTTVLTAGSSTNLTSNSIMLNSYPDKVFVFVRDAQANLKQTSADVYCAIDGVSITVGSQSGICSNFLPVDLYRASYEAGSQQTWLEFTGRANGTSADEPDGENVVMSGSVWCADFGQTINIPEDYFAPGSLSTTQFQINVRFTNTTGKSINPELNVMFMNSGILSTSNGSSSAYVSGVLSKQVVLDANAQSPVQPRELERLVGGAGLLSGFKSFSSRLVPKLPSLVKHILGAVEHPVASEAANVLGHMGYGETGGKKGLKHRVY